MTAQPSDVRREPMKIGRAMPITEQADTGVPSYASVRALARQAEAAGFDSLWLFDHLLFSRQNQPTTGIWECWTMLAALAEATGRVQPGTLVTCTAFRNPAILAKMAATLDAISGGRLILGLGAGWHEGEFEAFGIPFDHRVDRFEEVLQIIVPLLRTEQSILKGATIARATVSCARVAHMPAARRSLFSAEGPRMLRLAARYADAWNTSWLGQPGTLATPYAEMLAACADEARDAATLDVTVGVNVTRGVAHVICKLYPINADTLTWFTEVLDNIGTRWATSQRAEQAEGKTGAAKRPAKPVTLLCSVRC